MRADVSEWFARRTSTASDWPLESLVEAKAGTEVAVVLPALNEAGTVGGIVEQIRRALVDDPGTRLVDDLVVLDSGSTDGTGAVARDAGARVVHRDEVFPQIPAVTGKGEAMWRAIAATRAEVLVFVDADLRSFTPLYVTGLLGPLLHDPAVHLVKAMYERPLVDGSRVVSAGGGRVTELVARPLLNVHWPHLAGIAQPLGGEYAARRALLERLAFPCGYGVEFAMLVDTLDRVGLDAIAQVDLGVRVHRHHDEQRLGLMAGEIWQTALDRLDPDGRIRRGHGPDVGTSIVHVERGPQGFALVEHDLAALVRPPLLTVPEYAARRRDATIG